MIRVATTTELSQQRNDAITYLTCNRISRHWELFFQDRSRERFSPIADLSEWRRSLCSNLEGIDPQKTLSSYPQGLLQAGDTTQENKLPVNNKTTASWQIKMHSERYIYVHRLTTNFNTGKANSSRTINTGKANSSRTINPAMDQK